MSDTERKVIEALSRLISPVAANNLLKRVLGGQSPDLLEPRSWVELIEGPLQQELRGVLSFNGVIPDLQRLAQQLSVQTFSLAVVSGPTRPTLEATDLGENIDLEKEQCRQALMMDLAREEGVLAV